MTLLKPRNGIDRDLTKMGRLFRLRLVELTFDTFIVDVVKPDLSPDRPNSRVETTTTRFANSIRWVTDVHVQVVKR